MELKAGTKVTITIEAEVAQSPSGPQVHFIYEGRYLNRLGGQLLILDMRDAAITVTPADS